MNTFVRSIKNYFWLLAAAFLLAPGSAFAQSLGQSTSGCTSSTQICNPIQYNSITDLLNAAIKIVLSLGTIVAVLFFIYAGFKLITAQGNPEKVSEAHTIFKNAAIGTAILLSAQLIATAIYTTISNLH